MSKGKCAFKKSDIRRGIEAVESAGLKVARVEIQEGKFILIMQDGEAHHDATTDEQQWDAAVK